MGSGNSSPTPGLWRFATVPGELLAEALGLLLRMLPMGRVPLSCSRQNEAKMLQRGVKSYLNATVPARRTICGTKNCEAGTSWVAMKLGRLLLICAAVPVEDPVCK